MKKKYQKPFAAVEHYKLSQSIAACSIIVGLTNNSCVVASSNVPDQTRAFAMTWPAYFQGTSCDKDVASIQDNDSLCYHTQAAALFTSV